MTAPSDTVRSAPSGIPLQDGYPTKIAFKTDPDICFWEKTVTPPAVDGGDPIDLTTMHNSAWVTRGPQSLLDLGEFQVTALYDPNLYDLAAITAQLVNVNTEITIHFPDGSTLAFWGYLRSIEPGSHERGTAPEVTLTIVPTNYDDANDEESGPVLTEVAGT